MRFFHCMTLRPQGNSSKKCPGWVETKCKNSSIPVSGLPNTRGDAYRSNHIRASTKGHTFHTTVKFFSQIETPSTVRIWEQTGGCPYAFCGCAARHRRIGAHFSVLGIFNLGQIFR
ncbi:unnamed protein product [Kuraishia capsulata CBS 1993]|uniref:Uncharacterized protein n=1 Tax=Kuraishia capsulata CBS 1993 TaxID=1382522 RepID=W6MIL4_9ASCO|nr:uncharacterized protein KUCA_T00002290001 [Kuraishia capsulata CBS 1993]CDK26319.1 unnamed protein product [Kuraishia capsulata CBS 1993]